MTERVVAVLVRPPTRSDSDLAAAMLEDVVDLVADTPQVGSALALVGGATDGGVAWPGTPMVAVATPTVAEALTATADLATDAVAVVVADVPDLPTLLLGKLFSALAGPPRRSVAVCPAEGGGLVAVATGVPGPPDWLAHCDVGFDDLDALSRLRDAAPRHDLAVGPGWHRVRSPADAAMLDRGLEGWDATRAVVDSRELDPGD